MSDDREPVVVRIELMRDEADCAICCLVMLLGKTYPEVLAACRHRNPTLLGLTDRQLMGVARRLGHTLRFHAGPPDDDDVGILDLDRGDLRHMVLYLRGTIVDPRGAGELWTDLDAFVRDRDWAVLGLWQLVVKR